MSGHILIVDDEMPIRRLLRVAIERSGYATVEADCGAAALDALRRSVPKLVLLDLGLPDRDGLELIGAFREKLVPIIVLTAREASSEKVAALGRTPCQPTAAARISRPGGSQALGLQAGGARRDPVETDRCRGLAVARTAGAGVRLSLSESSPETLSPSARHARPVAGAARTPSARARNSTAEIAAIPTGAPRPRPVRCG